MPEFFGERNTSDREAVEAWAARMRDWHGLPGMRGAIDAQREAPL